jgi:hypothetical protein
MYPSKSRNFRRSWRERRAVYVGCNYETNDMRSVGNGLRRRISMRCHPAKSKEPTP